MRRVIFLFGRITLDFIKIIFGIVQYPHLTYQRLSLKKPFWHLFYIWVIIFFSLLWAEGVKHGVFKHPLFFAISLGVYFTIVLLSYLLITFLIYILGRLICRRGDYLTILILWGFSYLPTVFWFLFISLIFIIFPPPRGYTMSGYLLSGFTVIVSIALFYWKLLLYYMTLRIGLKITWGKIIKISMLFFPAVIIYSFLLYKIGVFKVPFL